LDNHVSITKRKNIEENQKTADLWYQKQGELQRHFESNSSRSLETMSLTADHFRFKLWS
jgi:hypothetical protein